MPQLRAVLAGLLPSRVRRREGIKKAVRVVVKGLPVPRKLAVRRNVLEPAVAGLAHGLHGCRVPIFHGRIEGPPLMPVRCGKVHDYVRGVANRRISRTPEGSSLYTYI